MDEKRTPAIVRLLAQVQAGLDRVHPSDLEREAFEGALVVDTRPVEQRVRDGELPGALVVGRNVLEWRLDPTSPWRLPEADTLRDNGGRVVLVCDEGYISSLAAATLRELGVARATDLVGGYQAWALHMVGRSALRAQEAAEVGHGEGDGAPLGGVDEALLDQAVASRGE